MTSFPAQMIVFWDVLPCVEVEQRFTGAYCPVKALIMEAVKTSETSVKLPNML
jgi:hypothetical protein